MFQALNRRRKNIIIIGSGDSNKKRKTKTKQNKDNNKLFWTCSELRTIALKLMEVHNLLPIYFLCRPIT